MGGIANYSALTWLNDVREQQGYTSLTASTCASWEQVHSMGGWMVQMPPAEPKPRKWKCAHCGRKNKVELDTCRGCGAPEP